MAGAEAGDSFGVFLRRHGVHPGRRRGQHFLVDPRLLQRIAAAAGLEPGTAVLEIGPGVGTLTRVLQACGARVLAVELDRGLGPALRAMVAGGPPQGEGWSADRLRAVLPAAEPLHPQVAVLWEDALRLDWPRLAALQVGPWTVCSNLPYYILGPLLASWLPSPFPWARAVLTVQREAAQRMAAGPGQAAYGAFSCLVRYHARIEVLFVLRAGAFYPPPRVESAVVRLTPWPEPPVPLPWAQLRPVVRAAFAHRRKTLRNALQQGLGLPAPAVQALLGHAGVPGEERAERLDLPAFAALARALQALGHAAG